MAKKQNSSMLPDSTIIEVISILKKDREKVYKKIMTFMEWKILNRTGRNPKYEYIPFQLNRSSFKNVILLN